MKRWGGAAICALFAFVVLPASPVAAHASFVDSNLVDGSVVAASPPTVELRFSDAVLLTASHVHLLHLGSADEVDLALTTAHNGTTVVAAMPALPRGAYIVRYVVVDPADLHKTVGSLSFGVGVPAPPSEAGEQVDGSWLSIALRAVTDGVLLLAVGAVVVAGLLTRRGWSDLARVTSLVTRCSCVVAIGWVGLLAADAASVGLQNVRWGSLVLGSDPGRRALIGVQMTAGVWWASRLVNRAASLAARRFTMRILAVLMAGLVIAAAYGGHAGIGGSFGVGVGLRVVHVGSVCVWIGAVAATWLLGKRDRRVRQLWPSVSRLAAVGLIVTGASGLLMSGRVVATVTALLATTYGRRIVIKAALLVVLATLGGLAARRIQRGDAPRRVPVELGAACVAIVVAALLVSSAPARGERFTPVPAASPQIVTSDLRDLTVSASIEPARPGPNLMQVRVLETRRPSPGPIENVVVRVIGGDGTVVAERTGLPTSGLLEWSDLVLPNPGTYNVEVDVTRPAAPIAPFSATWTVDVPPVPRARTVVSDRSWAPFAALLAVGWALIGAAGWWATRRCSVPAQRACRAENYLIGHSTQSNRDGFSIFDARGTMQDVEERHVAEPRMGNTSRDGSQLKV